MQVLPHEDARSPKMRRQRILLYLPKEYDQKDSWPLLLFLHGAKDPTVPLEHSEKMVEALKKAGGSVNFTVCPEAGHDSWTETYNNPELYKWLLQQKRTPRKPEGSKK
jgi:dipeptidyl aminopeptidase/acylaminoacyl peptidase